MTCSRWQRSASAVALADVAGAVAAAGDRQRAEQIARTITDPRQQAQALTEVAKVVGLPRAGHLLGQAFVLGSWLTPLLVLAKLYPQEVIRIADAVCADEPSHDAQWILTFARVKSVPQRSSPAACWLCPRLIEDPNTPHGRCSGRSHRRDRARRGGEDASAGYRRAFAAYHATKA